MSGTTLHGTWRALSILRTLASNTDVGPAHVEDSIALGSAPLVRFVPHRSLGPVLVLLHGVTARGAADRQLVRLARVLAAHGVTSYVPQLAGLARGCEDEEDLVRVDQAIHAASLGGVQSVSLLGFSLGGGYGLVCAANPASGPLLSRVAVVGAHHRLDDVWRVMSQRLEDLLQRIDQASADDLYCVLWRALQRLSKSDVELDTLDTIRSLLLDYCDGVDLQKLRSLVMTRLVAHWPVIAAHHPSDHSLALSPAGRLGQVQAPVSLLHAPDDTLVPAEHAQLNFRELCQRHRSTQQFVTTALLEHVRPRLRESLSQVPALVRCFAELIS